MSHACHSREQTQKYTHGVVALVGLDPRVFGLLQLLNAPEYRACDYYDAIARPVVHVFCVFKCPVMFSMLSSQNSRPIEGIRLSSDVLRRRGREVDPTSEADAMSVRVDEP